MSPATGLARLAVHALAGAGVGHVILCPGSRSAPLAYALHRAGGTGSGSTSGPELHVRHDERAAAFTALGIGLAGGSIGAVVTTSGTAAANLLPAVLEAHHANRPLVLVTADRPPELRGTWANQTSDLQAGLFGAAVRARLDLDDLTAAADPDAAYRAMAEVLAATLGRSPSGHPAARPGPVHLNLGFADPLVPDDDEPVTAAVADPLPTAAGEPNPGPVLDSVLGPVLDRPLGPGTVVLAGHGAGPDARWLAEAAGLPLLAEPSSGARGGPNAIAPYRLLLELPEFAGEIRHVVVFGRPTLSRPVTRLLGRADVDVALVSPFPDWPDPGRAVRRFAGVAVGPSTPAPPDGWLRRWRTAGAAATAAIDAVLDAEAVAGRLTGPLLARELWAAVRPGEHLMAAASNPIRDLDLTAAPGLLGPTPQVHANRGLSGIDGTLSTATGLALAGGPTRVLIGDLAFLHDLGGLSSGPGERRPDLQVVVVNDDGGGIFSLLEYGERAAHGPVAAAEFDRLFGTPHGADLGALCRGLGVGHEPVKDVDRLRTVLAAPPSGVGVIEVVVDRTGLRDLHSRLRAAAHRAAHRAALHPS